jgi:hypothetical protein
MSSNNGLMGAAAFRKPGVPYYLQEGAEIVAPTLVSPLQLKSADEGGEAVVAVGGLAAGVAGPYTGAIFLEPGPSSAGAAAAGLAIRSGAGRTIVEVGADAESSALLYIAGPSGVGQVYDEVYNQPVALQPITKVQTAPLLTPANPEEILRATQPAIAAAIATPGSQFNIFAVPRSGAYMVQTEIAIGNATAVNTVAIPSTLVGGVPIWKSISLGFQVQGTVTAVPYASFEVIGGDYYGDQAFAANGIITKTFTSVAILQAGVNYAVTLNAEAGWNIGDGGQIKTELIAMC